MKAFIRKNSVLLIVLGVLLIGAALLFFSLITAAKAEIGKSEVLMRSEDIADQPAAAPEMEASILSSMLEHRRKTRIPVVDNVYKVERGKWTNVVDFSQEDADKAKTELIRIVNGLFGYPFEASELSAEYWRDETGFRDDYWRITDAEALMIGCLKAKDLSLLAIDFDVVKAFQPTANTADISTLLKRLTDTLGGIVASYEDFITASRSDAVNALANVQVIMEDGTCYLMGHCLNMGYDLYAVSAHPDEDCMYEHIHWTADSEFSEAHIRVKSEANFLPGEPEAGDMTREQAIAFYQRFVTAAKGEPDAEEPIVSFWLDKSGARENYWEITGKTANLSVAAITRRLIYTTINEMDVSEGTPGYSVSQISYDKIEKNLDAFYAYIRHIVEYVYGEDSVKDISVNAIADGVQCTIDVYLANESTVYEYYFYNSVLERIDYYFSDEIFWYGYSGWPANFLYENIETGETFYPQ